MYMYERQTKQAHFVTNIVMLHKKCIPCLYLNRKV
jgi:hypothetical protein